jgi:predicted extracellular nuclease
VRDDRGACDRARVSLYAAEEYRSSDHDPVIVDLNLRTERIYLSVVMRAYPQP